MSSRFLNKGIKCPKCNGPMPHTQIPLAQVPQEEHHKLCGCDDRRDLRQRGFTFKCPKCKREHVASAYVLAQQASGHSLSCTCTVCETKFTIPEVGRRR